MQFLFIDDESGFARIDMWLAALVSLTLCYLVLAIILLSALSLDGWDLTGGLALAIATPIVLAKGLFFLFQPLRRRSSG